MARAGFERRWRTVKIADPAAGADWTLKAPGGTAWRIVSVFAHLVTSAVVGNRQTTLRADDQTRTWFAQEAPAVIPANTTIDFCGHTGAFVPSGSVLTLMWSLPSEGLLLLPGNRLLVSTANLGVADQWSLITAFADEIPSDNPYISTEGFSPEPSQGA